MSITTDRTMNMHHVSDFFPSPPLVVKGMAGLTGLIWRVGGLHGDAASDLDTAIDAFLTAHKVSGLLASFA